MQVSPSVNIELEHSDAITYKLCEVLQEFILYTASNNT